MFKKSGTIDSEESERGEKNYSRQEIDTALARLQKIAESLPPVDVVAIVREGRDASSKN